MTNRERIIVSAYTGYLLCDFSDVQKYAEEKLGRPVWAYEFADKKFVDLLQEKSKADYLSLAGKGD